MNGKTSKKSDSKNESQIQAPRGTIHDNLQREGLTPGKP